ncbi:MAG: sulfurtransferase TusA family protein [Devosia sp.]
MSEDILDARGLKCPLPVLKLQKRIGELPVSAALTLLATDPIARIDIPLYCTQNGHSCTVSSAAGALRFEIVKGAAAPG